jgi:hypothetical protein
MSILHEHIGMNSYTCFEQVKVVRKWALWHSRSSRSRSKVRSNEHQGHGVTDPEGQAGANEHQDGG